MGVILLVRHGQASAGAEDYDVLSRLGGRQAALLGAALKERGVAPVRVVAGTMVRQRETALLAAEAGEWSADVEDDARWNEFDHRRLLDADGDVATVPADAAGLDLLDRDVARWASGAERDYCEPFADFTTRVEAAFDDLVGGIGPGETVVAVTSAGPIAWIASQLIGGGVPQWSCLVRVAVNSGVATVVVGRRGKSLVTFNEYAHLDSASVSYR